MVTFYNVSQPYLVVIYLAAPSGLIIICTIHVIVSFVVMLPIFLISVLPQLVIRPRRSLYRMMLHRSLSFRSLLHHSLEEDWLLTASFLGLQE
jgi:hypothetical protein